MDKERKKPAADRQAVPGEDPPAVSTDSAQTLTVDLDDWVLTPAQRTFIKSLLADEDDDKSDSDR